MIVAEVDFEGVAERLEKRLGVDFAPFVLLVFGTDNKTFAQIGNVGASLTRPLSEDPLEIDGDKNISNVE